MRLTCANDYGGARRERPRRYSGGGMGTATVKSGSTSGRGVLKKPQGSDYIIFMIISQGKQETVGRRFVSKRPRRVGSLM